MMEQMEFDCRLDSERELEENVNIALEFACKQVKENSRAKVQNRHDGYGIASEYYATMKTGQKKVDESMKDFLRILPADDDAKAVEAASSLKNAATQLVLDATKLAAQADRIMHDLYDEVAATQHLWKTTSQDLRTQKNQIRETATLIRRKKTRRKLNNGRSNRELRNFSK